MSRLTPKEREKGWANKVPVGLAIEKLAHYEDLEEAGRLIELPCTVGEIIYRINPGAKDPIIPMGVVSIELKGVTDTFKEIKCKDCAFGGENYYRFTDIGKTVFLTEAEAEAKLAELKGGEKDA